MLADKGAYDGDRPPRLTSCQIKPQEEAVLQRRLYRERSLKEPFFSTLEYFRRMATHYDRLAEDFLAMVQLNAAVAAH